MTVLYSTYYDFLTDTQQLKEEIIHLFNIYNRRQLYFAPPDMPYKKGAGGMTYELPPLGFTEGMKKLMIDLQNFTGYNYDMIFVNRYLNGSYHLGWHSDDSPEFDQSRPICIVSIGATRKLEIEHTFSKSIHNNIVELPSGSLFMMHKGMQNEYMHRIIKEPEIQDERISLTIRGYKK
jgi:hypothetical protein